jgi:hypothetical protein
MVQNYIPKNLILKYLVDRGGFANPSICVANYAGMSGEEYSQLLDEVATAAGVPRDKIEEDIICNTTYAGMPYSGSDLRIEDPFKPARKRIYSFNLWGYVIEIWRKN